MKKLTFCISLFVIIMICNCIPASATVSNNIVKVGLRTGSSALYSANLQNEVGEGFLFGFYDQDREFEEIGSTGVQKISMTAAGEVFLQSDGTYSPSGGKESIGAWHIELCGFDSFGDASEVAEEYNGYPAWIDWEYVVRIGNFDSRSEAENAAFENGLDDFQIVCSGSTGILVTVTGTTQILFEFDCHGGDDFAIYPDSVDGDEARTWFKGYRYAGGFEYQRITGGNINVINVVDLESYVKGVVPFEMSNSWPLAALEAQAVCARTFACGTTKHNSSGYDVCNTTDCQVYYGFGGQKSDSVHSDEAVDNTRGLLLYYDGELARSAVYHSSDGGATEDAVNVWGSNTAYLIGKPDPYESRTSIPNYTYTVTYTASEISWILQQKGYGVGTVQDIQITELTPMGNVKKLCFTGTEGSRTVSGDLCRTIFYSSTYNKSVKSLRFRLNGDSIGGEIADTPLPIIPERPEDTFFFRVNRDNRISSITGSYAISGNGMISEIGTDMPIVISSRGKETLLTSSSLKNSSGSFTISGSGSGHNVGMSQYGAKAMAEAGFGFEEILSFYYTDIEIHSR